MTIRIGVTPGIAERSAEILSNVEPIRCGGFRLSQVQDSFINVPLLYVAELRSRGIGFLPSHELDELLQKAGANSGLVEEVSKAERRPSAGSSSDEIIVLAKIMTDTEQKPPS